MTSRDRCDRCKKWRKSGDTFTLPEELYSLLESDNEFSICLDCNDKYTIENWIEWIPVARKQGLSFKSWEGK